MNLSQFQGIQGNSNEFKLIQVKGIQRTSTTFQEN